MFSRKFGNFGVDFWKKNLEEGGNQTNFKNLCTFSLNLVEICNQYFGQQWEQWPNFGQNEILWAISLWNFQLSYFLNI